MITQCPSPNCRKTLPAAIRYCAYCGTRQQGASTALESSKFTVAPASSSTAAMQGLAASLNAPLPASAPATMPRPPSASRSAKPVALMIGVVAVLLVLGGVVLMMIRPGGGGSNDGGNGVSNGGTNGGNDNSAALFWAQMTATAIAESEKPPQGPRGSDSNATLTAIAESLAQANATMTAITQAGHDAQSAATQTAVAHQMEIAVQVQAQQTASARDTAIAAQNATATAVAVAQAARWKIRLYNTDDHGIAGLNGVVIAETSGVQGSTEWIDITDKMVAGDNILYFGEYNLTGGYTWGFAVEHGDTTVWSNEAGTSGQYGANGDDRSRPMQTVYSQTLILHSDGSVTESSDNDGQDSPSGPLGIGNSVVIIGPGIAIHGEPGEGSPNIGSVVNHGRELFTIVGGPVILPTTSDDDRPMLRRWWQVTGWDGQGTPGWVTSRYIGLAP